MQTYIDRQIENSKSSKELSIVNVKISDKDWLAIAQLTHLKQLFLNNIESFEIPEELKNLKQLEEIVIFGDNILKIPIFVLELPKLKSLDLQTRITDFSFLKHLKNLTYLGLSYCDLYKIPDAVFYLKNLEILEFISNEIKIIPNRIVELTSLKELNLNYNSISEIPAEIAFLENLYFPKHFNNPLKALQFGYLFSNKTNKFDFDKLLHIIPVLFGINNNSNRNFCYIKNNDNYAFVEIVSNFLDNYWSSKLIRDAFEIYKDKNPIGILIHVFGNCKTQSNFLNIIRSTINKWIENQNIVYTSLNIKSDEKKENNINCTRFFYYNTCNIQTKLKREIFDIDFEKLLKYKSLEKNTYFHEEYGEEIPVLDLLKYIGAEHETIKTKWNGSLYITNIEINNFKIFSDISCEFSKDINILIGHNGLGKSSFLQALTLSLLSVSNVDKSNEFEKYISFNNAKSDITTYWGDEYRNVFIFKNEIKHGNYLDIPQKLILAYGVNLNTNKEISHTEITNELINGNLISYSTKSIFNEFSTNFFDPIIILERLFLEKRGRENKLIDSIINLIKNTINNYLSLFSEFQKISVQGDFADYYYNDLNNNKLQTGNLSEGYKDFVLQITDIIVRVIASRNNIFENKNLTISETLFNTVRGVIIIDEFDRHLHPDVQRKFLFQLRKDFKNIQFILSTHNILSLQSAEGYTALIINTKNKKLEITKKSITRGLSIESIYNGYFEGNNAIFSNHVEDLLAVFKKYIDKQRKQILNKEEQDKFKNATNELISYGERTKGIVYREIRQLERLTRKSIKI